MGSNKAPTLSSTLKAPSAVIVSTSSGPPTRDVVSIDLISDSDDEDKRPTNKEKRQDSTTRQEFSLFKSKTVGAAGTSTSSAIGQVNGHNEATSAGHMTQRTLENKEQRKLAWLQEPVRSARDREQYLDNAITLHKAGNEPLRVQNRTFPPSQTANQKAMVPSQMGGEQEGSSVCHHHPRKTSRQPAVHGNGAPGTPAVDSAGEDHGLFVSSPGNTDVVNSSNDSSAVDLNEEDDSRPTSFSTTIPDSHGGKGYRSLVDPGKTDIRHLNQNRSSDQLSRRTDPENLDDGPFQINTEVEDSGRESDDSRAFFNYIRGRRAAKRAQQQPVQDAEDSDDETQRSTSPFQVGKPSRDFEGIVSSILKEQQKSSAQNNNNKDPAERSRLMRQEALEARKHDLREYGQLQQRQLSGTNGQNSDLAHKRDDLESGSLFGGIDDNLSIGAFTNPRVIHQYDRRDRNGPCSMEDTSNFEAQPALNLDRKSSTLYNHGSTTAYDAERELQGGSRFFQRRYRRLEKEKNRARTLTIPSPDHQQHHRGEASTSHVVGNQPQLAPRMSDGSAGIRYEETRDRKKRRTDSWAGFLSRSSPPPRPDSIPPVADLYENPRTLRVENDIGLLRHLKSPQYSISSKVDREPAKPLFDSGRDQIPIETRRTQTTIPLFHHTRRMPIHNSKEEYDKIKGRQLDLKAVHNAFIQTALHVFIYFVQRHHSPLILQRINIDNLPEKVAQNLRELRNYAAEAAGGKPLQGGPRKRVQEIGRNMVNRREKDLLNQGDLPGIFHLDHPENKPWIDQLTVELAGPSLWAKICSDKEITDAEFENARNRRYTPVGKSGNPLSQPRQRPRSAHLSFGNPPEMNSNRRVAFDDTMESIDLEDRDQEGSTPMMPHETHGWVKTQEELRNERSKRAKETADRIESDKIAELRQKLLQFKAAEQGMQNGSEHGEIDRVVSTAAPVEDQECSSDDVSISSDEDETPEDYEQRKRLMKKQQACEKQGQQLSRLYPEPTALSARETNVCPHPQALLKRQESSSKNQRDQSSPAGVRSTIARKSPHVPATDNCWNTGPEIDPDESKEKDQVPNNGQNSESMHEDQGFDSGFEDIDMIDEQPSSETASRSALESDAEPTVLVYNIRMTLEGFRSRLHLPKSMYNYDNATEETILPFPDSSQSLERRQQRIELRGFQDTKSAGKVVQKCLGHLARVTDPTDWSKMDNTYGVDEKAGSQYHTFMFANGAIFSANIEREELTWLEISKTSRLKNHNWRKDKAAPSYIYKVISETWTEETIADATALPTLNAPGTSNDGNDELLKSPGVRETTDLSSMISNEQFVPMKKQIKRSDHFMFSTIAHANQEAANLLFRRFSSRHEGQEQGYIRDTVEKDLIDYLSLLTATGRNFDRSEVLAENSLGDNDETGSGKTSKEMIKVLVVEERVWGPRP